MSKRPIEIMLLVEDNPGDARLIQEMFNDQGLQNVELKHVECMEEAERFLALRAIDIILLDLEFTGSYSNCQSQVKSGEKNYASYLSK